MEFTVVPGETGLLVPPQDTAAFAEAIGRILDDELWARKLRKRASERVQQNFSWTGVSAQLSDLYRRSLAESIMNDGVILAPRKVAYSRLETIPTKSLTKVS